MGWGVALTLGAVQGLTEFLPVSSSAHVSLVGRLFGGRDPGAAFTAVTQLGTEAAVLWWFRDDVTRIVRGWTGAVTGRVPHEDPDARLGWSIVAGTVPVCVVGAGLRHLITGPFRDLQLTAAMLAGFGVVMAVVDEIAEPDRGLGDMTVRDGVRFGWAQSLSLVPGVSRSGATITGGLLLGYPRPDAARYSFLLAIPAVLLSGAQQALDVTHDPEPPEWCRIAAATGVAFGTGYVVIGWFMHHLAEADLRLFVRYRVALAGLVAALLAAGVVRPDDQV
ncbi:undecaprenyl-diphosphate phosphatase [Mobilicoccus pelagius]|uniref:Undecaprenyl-diphosphatase n=1 Tax=Mobilicoccus pelagius NBRC 104925 TaxID=1089455 RepID=H5UTE0_9MICO|nr:undecaprenyl-diphosphate phosphatase [Mobilicoccus pelagius]GAB48998.1 undecaprenyl-diphosphatase [Mobilicoccus pelagius NBRC 104925]